MQVIHQCLCQGDGCNKSFESAAGSRKSPEKIFHPNYQWQSHIKIISDNLSSKHASMITYVNTWIWNCIERKSKTRFYLLSFTEQVGLGGGGQPQKRLLSNLLCSKYFWLPVFEDWNTNICISLFLNLKIKTQLELMYHSAQRLLAAYLDWDMFSSAHNKTVIQIFCCMYLTMGICWSRD